MKKLLLVRHGETDFNLANVVQGKGIDAPLNETGRRQALQLFTHYANEPFDFVFTSMLLRTHQTVKLFLDKGLPTEALANLDEIGWGELEGKPALESREKIHALLQSWREGNLDEKFAGGESPLDLQARHQQFIQRYRAMPYSNFLVCTHGRAMRILLSTMLQTPLTDMDQYHHKNTSAYRLLDDGRRITLVGSNSLEHLGNGTL